MQKPPLINKEDKVIIGITGAAQSGKDTLARLLMEQFPQVARTQTGFAGPIYNAFNKLSGYSLEEIETLKKDPKSNVRHYLQCIGDMIKEKNHKSFVHMLDSLIEESSAKLFIISDLRFNYEAGWIYGRGGSIIRIFNRAAEELAERDKHKSEQEYPSIIYDWSIANEGSLEDFARESRHLAHFIKERYKL